MIESNDCAGRRSRAALVIVLLSAVAVAGRAEGGPPAAALAVRLALRNSRGQVGCMLFGSAKGFPRDPAAALQRKWCGVANAQSVCSFDSVPAGTYAIACFHDENGNGRLDTGIFGIPAEGTVASNHAKGFMGPPSFEDAKFSLAGGAAELRLRVSY